MTTDALLAACAPLQKVRGILAGAALDEIASAAILAFLAHPSVKNRLDEATYADLCILADDDQ